MGHLPLCQTGCCLLYTSCDLMVLCTQTEEKKTGQRMGDPTCGSGRLLLAYHARNPGNYLIGEDINRTCCLMKMCIRDRYLTMKKEHLKFVIDSRCFRGSCVTSMSVSYTHLDVYKRQGLSCQHHLSLCSQYRPDTT